MRSQKRDVRVLMQINQMSYSKMLLWLAKKYLPNGSVRQVGRPLLEKNIEQADAIFSRILATHWSNNKISDAKARIIFKILHEESEESLKICMEANLL